MTDYLIVVDMQRDLVSGVLGTAHAQDAVPAVAARIRRAREEGTQVLFTLHTQEEEGPSAQEGRQCVPHCIRGTQGWALEPQIAAQCARGMRSFEKSAFGCRALCIYLSEQALLRGGAAGEGLTIELCGMHTDTSVLTNALLIQSALPEAQLCVQAALCAGTSGQAHSAALTVMASCRIGVL